MKVGDGWWVSMALTSAMPRNRYVEYIITKEFCVCVCVSRVTTACFSVAWITRTN